MNAALYIGDLRDRLAELPDASIDAIVTDPPYHLTTGKKGGTGIASLNVDSPAGRSRIGTGFMGKKWDGGDVAFRPETWAALLRVAKPGAHLIAFGGTRTFHRIWCAIEDGGWQIRDTMMWLYGSGFPKSKNQSGEWQGWGTALKPAYEPIVLARKPFAGTVAGNLQRHRTGAINIEGCRIETGDDLNGGAYAGPERDRDDQRCLEGGNLRRGVGEYDQPLGRWPANLLHDGSEEVVAAFPESDGQLLDASTDADARKTQNVYGAFKRGRGDEPSADSENDGAVGFKMRPGARRGDVGSAARFFWCPKASRDDRDSGCESLPDRPGGVRSETSGQHITRRDGGDPGPVKNDHPTVKPTELMQYLCRLVAPQGATVLDPFMGSGSTGKAAMLELMNFVGIEREPEYIEIARRRIGACDPLFTTLEVA